MVNIVPGLLFSLKCNFRLASSKPLQSDAGGQQPELCTLARAVGGNLSEQRNSLGRPLLVQIIKGFDGDWSPLLFYLVLLQGCVVEASTVGRWRPTLGIVQVGTTVLLSCDRRPLLLRRVCEQNWLRSSWLLRVRAKEKVVVGVRISRGQRTLLVWRQASCAIHISG